MIKMQSENGLPIAIKYLLNTDWDMANNSV
jgi:hypothetical protein